MKNDARVKQTGETRERKIQNLMGFDSANYEKKVNTLCFAGNIVEFIGCKYVDPPQFLLHIVTN